MVEPTSMRSVFSFSALSKPEIHRKTTISKGEDGLSAQGGDRYGEINVRSKEMPRRPRSRGGEANEANLE